MVQPSGVSAPGTTISDRGTELTSSSRPLCHLAAEDAEFEGISVKDVSQAIQTEFSRQTTIANKVNFIANHLKKDLTFKKLVLDKQRLLVIRVYHEANGPATLSTYDDINERTARLLEPNPDDTEIGLAVTKALPAPGHGSCCVVM